MTHLFYIMVIFCLMIEIITLLNLKGITLGLSKYRRLKKENNGDIPRDKISNKFIIYTICSVSYLIICLIGLMSSQWICFLAIIVQSLSVSRLRRKYIIVGYLDSILSFAILLFILINKYHLHINLLNEILKIG